MQDDKNWYDSISLQNHNFHSNISTCPDDDVFRWLFASFKSVNDTRWVDPETRRLNEECVKDHSRKENTFLWDFSLSLSIRLSLVPFHLPRGWFTRTSKVIENSKSQYYWIIPLSSDLVISLWWCHFMEWMRCSEKLNFLSKINTHKFFGTNKLLNFPNLYSLFTPSLLVSHTRTKVEILLNEIKLVQVSFFPVQTSSHTRRVKFDLRDFFLEWIKHFFYWVNKFSKYLLEQEMLVEICSRLRDFCACAEHFFCMFRRGEKVQIRHFCDDSISFKFSGPFLAYSLSPSWWPAAASNANRWANCSSPILACSAAIFSKRVKCFSRARSARF